MILFLERIAEEDINEYKHIFTSKEHKYFIISSRKLIEEKTYNVDFDKCQELRANYYYAKDIRKIAKDTDDVTLEKLIREALLVLKEEDMMTLPETHGVQFYRSKNQVDTIAKALHEALKIQKKNDIMLLYKEAYELLIKSQYSQMPMDDRLRMIQIEVELDKYWKSESENRS